MPVFPQHAGQHTKQLAPRKANVLLDNYFLKCYYDFSVLDVRGHVRHRDKLNLLLI